MFEKERNLIEETKRDFYDTSAFHMSKTFQQQRSMNINSNLFEILGGGSSIRVVFHFLRFFLSPICTHGMGTFFLEPFVHDVLNLDIPKFELKRADVTLYVTKYRNTWIPKISIVINQRLVVLFPGINDTEGRFLREQCEQWNADFVFLFTPHGNVPEWLQDDVHKVKCTCLSLKHDVINWVSYCMKQLDVNDSVIYKALSQFSEIIQNLLSGHTNDRDLFACADFILSSPENTKAALNIHDAVRSMVDNLRSRVFVAIRVELLKMTRWQLSNFKDCVKIGKDGYLYVRSDIRSEWQECSLCDYGAPNFKFPNEALFELCDTLSFNIFVSRCAKKIFQEF